MLQFCPISATPPRLARAGSGSHHSAASSPVTSPLTRKPSPSTHASSTGPTMSPLGLMGVTPHVRPAPRRSVCRRLDALPDVGQATSSTQAGAVNMAMDLLASLDITLPMSQFSSSTPSQLSAAASPSLPGTSSSRLGTPGNAQDSSATGLLAVHPAAPEIQVDKEAVRQLSNCLQSADDRLVQGALLTLSESLPNGRICAQDLVGSGIVTALSSVITERGLADETTTLALEVICRLVTPSMAPYGKELSLALVPPLLSLLRDGAAWMGAKGGLDPAQGSSRGPPTHAAWSHMTANIFFAISCVLRLARVPEPSAALLEGGSIPLLLAFVRSPMARCRLYDSQPSLIPQVSVFAMYKLARAGPDPEANLYQLLHSGGLPVLCDLLGSGGVDVSARDMCSSLLLDIAILEHSPTHCAKHGAICSVVQVILNSHIGSVERMHAVLILARLANNSPDCQMDAVREGVVPPLISMAVEGSHSEQSHACRLLAILAQSMPCHESMVKGGIFAALLGIAGAKGACKASGEAALAVEHAASVAAVMLQNTDVHFNLVKEGLVPALVGLLNSGSHKTCTFVLASLLLLTIHESRHAAVVTRAGAVPLLLKALTNKSGSMKGQVQEYAAAVLVSMSRYTDIQTEIAECNNGVSSLVSVLLNPNSPIEVRSHSAEALAHFCLVPERRRKLVSRSRELLSCLSETLTSISAPLRLWSATLINHLIAHDNELADEAMLCGIDRAVALLLLEEEEDGDGWHEDAWRARVQATWLLARLSSQQYHAKQCAKHGVIGPLMKVVSRASASNKITDELSRSQMEEGEAEAVPLMFPGELCTASSGSEVMAAECRSCQPGGVAAASLALRILYRQCDETRSEILQEMALRSWMNLPTVLPGLDKA